MQGGGKNEPARNSSGVAATEMCCLESQKEDDGVKKGIPFVREWLAQTQQVSPLLQTSLSAAFVSLWTALLIQAAMQAFVASQLALDCSSHSNVDGHEPPSPLHEPQPRC